MSVFALIDCNNFYASCERIFNPQLEGKPLVVLSNNDGCVIARSEEAKKIGIGMGQPYFQIKNLVNNNQVFAASSNFALYGDISDRVMKTLEYFTDDIEIYSIDEAFLDLSGLKKSELEPYGQEIRKTIRQWVGIPVSIGIAQTKTLAKAASKIAKKNQNGVVHFFNPQEIDRQLESIQVDDIWGIGRKYGQTLKKLGVKTALDFKRLKPEWILKKMTSAGFKTWQEINGQDVIGVCLETEKPKSISTSRTFAKEVRSKSQLNALVSSYTARAAEKLRQDEMLANEISVYISTSHFSHEDFYANFYKIKMPQPSAFTPDLICWAQKALDKIFIDGHNYKKAGICLEKLTDKNCVQSNLFCDAQNEIKKTRLMRCLDEINYRFGVNTIKSAAEDEHGTDFLAQNFKSPNYTTNWQDLKIVT